MKWLNEPESWNERGGTLTLTADRETDFWRLTHDGMVRNNGHFYHREVEGDFTCDVVLEGNYRNLYDHAGLMLRLDDTTWLKCGVEFVGGVQQASVVVTRGYSDWSVVALASNPKAVRLQLQRSGGTVTTSYALNSGDHTMLRQSYLTEVAALQIGMMCAAPKGADFGVTFEDFYVQTTEDTSTARG